MEFVWDARKAANNKQKHGISFEEAATIFGDPLSVTFVDPDHSIDEDRYLILGQSNRGRLLIVAFTERNHQIRIISARELTHYEREIYEETIYS